MTDHTIAHTAARLTSTVVAGVLAAQTVLGGREIIEHGTLADATRLLGAGATIGVVYALAAVVFLAVTPLLEAVIVRVAPGARSARSAPFVVLGALTLTVGLLAAEWTWRDSATLALLAIAAAVLDHRITWSGVVRAARRR